VAESTAAAASIVVGHALVGVSAGAGAAAATRITITPVLAAIVAGGSTVSGMFEVIDTTSYWIEFDLSGYYLSAFVEGSTPQ
jgi:hypothetical protein